MSRTESGDPDYVEELVTITKGAGILVIGTAAGTVLKYVYELVIARTLGADLFGLFILGFSYFKIAEILSTLGLHNGILRYGAIFKGARDLPRLKGAVLSAIKIVAFAGAAILGASALFSTPISLQVFHNKDLQPVFIFFSLSLPFSALSMVVVYAIQSLKLVKPRIIVKEIYEPLTRLVFFLAFFFLGWKLFGVMAAFLVSSVTGVLLAVSLLKKAFPSISDKTVAAVYETKSLLNFSWPLFFTGFLNILFLWIGTLIAGLYVPENEIAYYGAAQRTAMLGIIILNSFSSIFAPIIADLYHREEWKKLENLFKTVTKWIFALSLPVFVMMIAFSKSFLRIYGEDFVSGSKSLIILSAGQLLSAAAGPYGFMIMMSGKSKINLLNSLFVAAVNIVLCFLLVPKMGIIGAACAASIALFLISVIGLIETHRIYRIHPYRSDFIKPLLGGCLAAALSIFIEGWLHSRVHFIISLLAGSLGFLLCYFFIVLVLGIRSEEKIISQRIKEKYFLRGKTSS